MPCFEVFDQQDQSYRLKVLPSDTPIMSVEAACTQGWEKVSRTVYIEYCVYVSLIFLVLLQYSHVQFGINRFGMSAPCDE